MINVLINNKLFYNVSIINLYFIHSFMQIYISRIKGYTNERPEEFENLVQFSFYENSTTYDIEDYNNSCNKMFLVQEVIMFKTFFSSIIIIVMCIVSE